MAAFHGKEGTVWWDAADAVNLIQVSNITNWNCEVSADVAEKTTMQDTWKTYDVGFKDWTATVECYMETDGTEIDYSSAEPTPMGSAGVYLELYTEYDVANTTYRCLWGLATCTGISHGVNADGIATITYTFQGQGAIAFYSSEVERKSYA